jgi:hypothetical protein
MTEHNDISQPRPAMILFGHGKGGKFLAGWFGERDSGAVITAAAAKGLSLLSVSRLQPEDWQMIAQGSIGEKGDVMLNQLHRHDHDRLLEIAVQQEKHGAVAAGGEEAPGMSDPGTTSDCGPTPDVDAAIDDKPEDNSAYASAASALTGERDNPATGELQIDGPSADPQASPSPLSPAGQTDASLQEPAVQAAVEQAAVEQQPAASVGSLGSVVSGLLASLVPGDVVLAPEFERSGEISGYWPAVIRSVETGSSVVLVWRDEAPTYPKFMLKRDQLGLMPPRG